MQRISPRFSHAARTNARSNHNWFSTFARSVSPCLLRAIKLGASFTFVAALCSGMAQAQQPYVNLTSSRPASFLSTEVHYQRYILKNDLYVEEISFPVYAELPVGRSTSMSLRISPASVTGQHLESVAGLSDAQYLVSHARQFGGSSLVLSFGANLPSGKRALTQEEFETTVEISRNFYDFRTPSFGQGFNASPGLTWAVPLGDGFVLGIGAAYQYKGAFEPVEGMDESYHPGSEILLTGGVDLRVMKTAALSLDATYTLYGTDKIGSLEVFDSGNQLVTTIQYLQYQGFNELRVVGRYRTRGKGNLSAPGAAPAAALQTLPDQANLLVSYRMESGPTTSIGLHAGIHHFDETDVSSSKLLFSLGATPAVSLSRSVKFVTRFTARLGSFTGLDAGAGLSLQL